MNGPTAKIIPENLAVLNPNGLSDITDIMKLI